MAAALAVAALCRTACLAAHAASTQRFALSADVWSADGELLRVTRAADDQYRLWVPLARVSPTLVDAFLLKEDRWFYWHPGVNPVALARAAFRTYAGGDRQGGSTRDDAAGPPRLAAQHTHAAGKLRQIGAALWLEARYSKRDILEAYLNVVPFRRQSAGCRRGQPGCTSASHPIASRSARRSRWPSIPQRPVEPGRPVAWTRRPRWPRARGSAPRGSPAAAMRRRTAARSSLPIVARHEHPLAVARASLRRRGARPSAPHGTGPCRDDDRLAAAANWSSSRSGATWDGIGDVGHAATPPPCSSTRATWPSRAWVGSADFWNEAIDGQVNGVLAKRSPGSTLKPFVYALALDQGVLHPQTVLARRAHSFGPFTARELRRTILRADHRRRGAHPQPQRAGASGSPRSCGSRPSTSSCRAPASAT